MALFKIFGAAVVGVALAGCASSGPYSGGRTWEDGWRKGTVSSVKDELRWFQRASCGKVAAPGDKFVAVSYRTSGQTRWKYIPMQVKHVLAPQSRVLLNVNSCELVRDG